MKKTMVCTLITFICLLVFNKTVAQSDSLLQSIKNYGRYWDDSIFSKKNLFINKPLNLLFKCIKFSIEKYEGEIPFPYLPDTLVVKDATFVFSGPNSFKNYLHVVFSTPQRIPKDYFKTGNILDLATGWTTAKAAYLGQFVISDIW